MSDIVEGAISQFKLNRPDLFQGEKVLDENAYMNGVVDVLRFNGYCATRGGPSDEIGIKLNNSKSEQYDILLSSGFIRHYGFAVSCSPARF